MDLELDSLLKSIQTLSLNKLKAAYLVRIPEDLAPPASFWASYKDAKQDIDLCTRECLFRVGQNSHNLFKNLV
jgi:hypothetical protein